MIHIGYTNVDLVLILALILILGGVAYGVLLFVLSRFEPKDRSRHNPAPWSLPTERAVVFLIPCINEERVIGASMERLTALDYRKVHLVVIDDGTDDATANTVSDHPDPPVRLI